MAYLELRRVTISVHTRIELVHVVDDEWAIAGSLEPGIDLVVAKYSSFPFCSERWKLRAAVINNTVPEVVVSQSTRKEEEQQRTPARWWRSQAVF
jgi:hypothetical protein